MKKQVPQISETKFLQHYLQNAPHFMWFLGAGTSRSAGLPTAIDIIWDLKRRYYCMHENQTLQSHDINNNAIKQKIQTYMDSRGYPALWDPKEYSFYFDLSFGDDLSAQQKYINKVLSSDKVSLNIGHRVLAALIEQEQASIIFTTNFDDVIETAYAEVTGKTLSAYNLEGSYAALEALNVERFPLYCKIHGDFRYKKIKNLAEDLLSNDREIQKCFLAAATRYGLVLSGYSGRDENVMSMFQEAIDQNNAFPHGIFWTVTKFSKTAKNVRKFIAYAQNNGVQAHLVETGTFDEMLSKIWRQMNDKPQTLDAKVRTAQSGGVSIPLPAPGKQFPILRTNALPIISLPVRCGSVDLTNIKTFHDLKEKIKEKSPNAIFTYTDKVLFFGDEKEIIKLHETKENLIQPFAFDNAFREIATSFFLKSFFEETLSKALCRNKPLFHRRKNRTFYAVVREDAANTDFFLSMRSVLDYQGKPGYITGKVQGLKDVTWAEAVSIKIEERGGRLWVMLKPNIWIKPLSRRQEATTFLRKRQLYRYNNKTYALLDAWIGILLGSVGVGNIANVSCYPDVKYSAVFKIGTRTAYSKGG